MLLFEFMPYIIHSLHNTGDTLNKVGYTPSLACAVGSSLGNLTLALSTFEEPAFHRTHGWDLKNFDMNVQFFSFVEDLEIRSLIVEVHEKFCLDVKRDADLFPVSIIQGDCNVSHQWFLLLS